jgi:hypothetical protein
MAKKKAVKKVSSKRPKSYDKSTLAIIGSLDDVLKVSIASAKKPEKK